MVPRPKIPSVKQWQKLSCWQLACWCSSIGFRQYPLTRITWRGVGWLLCRKKPQWSWNSIAVKSQNTVLQNVWHDTVLQPAVLLLRSFGRCSFSCFMTEVLSVESDSDELCKFKVQSSKWLTLSQSSLSLSSEVKVQSSLLASGISSKASAAEKCLCAIFLSHASQIQLQIFY